MVSGRRLYKHVAYNKVILVSWIQEKCKMCGKYIGKYRHKYCKKCMELRDKQVKHIGHFSKWETYKILRKFFNSLGFKLTRRISKYLEKEGIK